MIEKGCGCGGTLVPFRVYYGDRQKYRCDTCDECYVDVEDDENEVV